MTDPVAVVKAAFRERGFWGLLFVGIAYFHRPLLLGETFFLRDLYLFYLPQEARLIKFLKAGEAPFWDPFLHGGTPYLADISGSPFYPLSLLGLWLPPTVALTFGIVLHFLFSAGAAYVLGRVLGVGQPAAFLGGAVYAYCGFALSQGNFLHRIQAMPYVPLLVLFWHLFLVDGRRRWFCLASACGVLQILAGAPTMIAPSLVLAFGWGLVRVQAQRRPVVRYALAWTALAVTIGALTAFQLLPTVELANASTRGSGIAYTSFSFWSLHPLRLLEFVLPGVLGPVATAADATYWGANLVDNEFPYFLSLYTSAGVLVLAFLGATAASLPHRRLRICLTVFVAISLVLALGRYLPFFEVLYHVVPGIRIFRYPVKFLAVGTLPLALLAAFGAQGVFASEWVGRRLRWSLAAAWLTCGLPAVSLLALSRVPAWSVHIETWLFGNSGPHITRGLSASASHALLFALLATLIGWLLRGALQAPKEARPIAPRALTWMFALVVLADLMTAGRGLNPTAAPEMISSVPEAARRVAREIGDGRLFRAPQPKDQQLRLPSDDVIWRYRWNQEVLQFYLGASYDLPMIFHRDFNGFEPKRTLYLADAVASLPREKSRPILDAASVSVVMTHEELQEMERVASVGNASGMPVHVYRNPQAARRLEWIGLWHTVESKEQALQAMLAPGFDPRRHAVVEAPIDARAKTQCASPASVELVVGRGAERVYQVSAPCDGILVFSETFYPGCEVRIDGRRVPLWRANVAFLATPIEAGEHEVVWRYVPRTFYWGLALSALTLCGLLLFLWATRRATRRSSGRRDNAV